MDDEATADPFRPINFGDTLTLPSRSRNEGAPDEVSRQSHALDEVNHLAGRCLTVSTVPGTRKLHHPKLTNRRRLRHHHRRRCGVAITHTPTRPHLVDECHRSNGCCVGLYPILFK